MNSIDNPIAQRKNILSLGTAPVRQRQRMTCRNPSRTQRKSFMETSLFQQPSRRHFHVSIGCGMTRHLRLVNAERLCYRHQLG